MNALKNILVKGKALLGGNETNVEILEQRLEELVRDAEKLADDAKLHAETLSSDFSESSKAHFQEFSAKLKLASASIRDRAKILAGKAREMSKDEAAGKYLTVNILSKNDEIIGRRGDMITYEFLSQTEAEGKLSHVLAHTSKQPLN